MVKEAHFWDLRPATLTLISSLNYAIAKGSVAHADSAVESAKRAFESGIWAGKTPDERSRILIAVAQRRLDVLDERIRALTQVRDHLATGLREVVNGGGQGRATHR